MLELREVVVRIRDPGWCDVGRSENYGMKSFEQYRQEALEELLPVGHTETQLCEHYIFACYQIERVRAVEASEGPTVDQAKQIGLLGLGRYRAGLERSRDRAYKQFREIQNERYQRQAPYSKPTNELPPLVKSAALRRVRMEYAFDHQVDPHIPEMWPYLEFAKRLPPPGFNTSTVDYPPKRVFERESPFPQPPLHVLERELKEEEAA